MRRFVAILGLLMVVNWLAALSACNGYYRSSGAADGETDGGPGAAPPPTPPPAPPPSAAIYRRGSLPPLFQLTPRSEYGRLAHGGVQMSDADFESPATTTSTSSKIDEIAAMIAAEHGTTIDLIGSPADRQRADLVPFRGNPSDVKHFKDGAVDKLYVPLGGHLTRPGNEVAVVSLAGQAQVTTRVRVGERPQRVAIHPAGLVFVCNQFSNYISIIDPRTDQLLTRAGAPVEVATEYMCSDLLFAPTTPAQPDDDQQYLFVANRWRHTVLMYEIQIERDPLSDRPIGITQELVKEIAGVGQNPNRLALNEQQNGLYAVSDLGGEMARIDLTTRAVTRRIFAGSPALDVVVIADQVFVPTLMPDRGLLSRDEVQKPQQVLAGVVRMLGVDGLEHEVHPGALFDSTRSYNFEDVRNGLLQLPFTFDGDSVYYTDDVSSEPNFVAGQKLLAGAMPQAIVRNAAGTRVWVALSGSKLVQELRVDPGTRPFSLTAVAGGTFATSERPFALALDEAANRLYVATWGGEMLEIFDLGSRQRLAQLDLGYAQPRYPATNVERGELLFYDASWSNNQHKTCALCHVSDLSADGVGFSNGATAPTLYHQVKPNHNLMTTGSYFWNGGFSDGDYTSLAFGAQTRTNCELIAFALIEGPSSNPATRIGDPNNRFTDGNVADCRPQPAGPDRLPRNFAQIQARIGLQKVVRQQRIEAAAGFPLADVSRLIDFYSVSELRLPPNPMAHLEQWGELDSVTKSKLARGRALFDQALCSSCHDPLNAYSPFTDNLDHGPGADWVERFISKYQNDPRVQQSLGVLPQKFLDGVSNSTPDSAPNVIVDPLDYFVPVCFDVSNCLQFDDPLSVIGNFTEESRRLGLLIAINLADKDRQFVPGNVRGQAKINTPSLRGVWTQPALLHHGYAHHISEAILPPGHPALAPGEIGYAVSNSGSFDVHGVTSNMSVEDVEALVMYVLSIE